MSCATLIKADDYAVGETGGSSAGTSGDGTGGSGAAAGTGVTDGGPDSTAAGGSLPGFMVSEPAPDAADTDSGTMPTSSGLKLCTSTMLCSDSGLVCQLSVFDRLQGLCVYPCTFSTDCASTHVCVGALPSFPYACLKRCTSTDCPPNIMSCVFLAGVGERVCLPSVWLKGIGDPCTSNADCALGKCSPYGFCTKSCAQDDPCANRRDGKDPADLLNQNGMHNWCLTLDGNHECVPGCDQQSPTICEAYPRTSCRLQTTFSADNYQAYVCVP